MQLCLIGKCAWQRRRIKPTVLVSFGLAATQPRLDSGTGGERDDRFRRGARRMPAAASRPPMPVAATATNDLTRTPALGEVWRPRATEAGDWLGCGTLADLLAMARVLRGAATVLQVEAEVGRQVLSELVSLEASLNAGLAGVRDSARILLHLFPGPMSQVFDAPFLGGLLRTDNVSEGDVREARRSSLLSTATAQSGDSSGSDLDAVPIAYHDRRDSRNSAHHQVSHANQQKLRDALLDWIRSGSWSSRATRPEAALRAWQLIAMVHEDNFSWFAKTLLHEYEQLERRSPATVGRDCREGVVTATATAVTPMAGAKSRLERLEERLTRTPAAADNPIVLLVSSANSFVLIEALRNVLFDTIDRTVAPISDGSVRSEPRLSAEIIRMAQLGRLLAACSCPLIGRYEDPVLCFVRDTLLEAHREGCLLAVLPLLIGWLRHAPQHEAGIAGLVGRLRTAIGGGRCASTTQAVLRLLLEAVPTGGGDSSAAVACPSLPDPPSRSFGSRLDEDASLDGLLFERILAHVRPDWRAATLEFSQIFSPLRSPATSPTIEQVAGSLAALRLGKQPESRRKIRPIQTDAAETGPSASGNLILQRKLRQWFWWQHPGLKELCDALRKYLLAESLEPGEVVRILWGVLPALIPPSLMGSRRMQELVICMIMEAAERVDSQR